MSKKWKITIGIVAVATVDAAARQKMLRHATETIRKTRQLRSAASMQDRRCGHEQQVAELLLLANLILTLEKFTGQIGKNLKQQSAAFRPPAEAIGGHCGPKQSRTDCVTVDAAREQRRR